MSRSTSKILELTLSPTPQSAAAARSALHRLELDPDTHADVALLISELVSAAVLDQVEDDGGALELTVSRGEAVRADVTATAPGLDRLARRDPESHGFTIRLLDDLSDAWGGTSEGDRTAVFFEVAIRG